MPAAIELRNRLKHFDIDDFNQGVKKELERVFKLGTVAFVQESAKHIPSLTGQARATLFGVARDLGVRPGFSVNDEPLSENRDQRKRLRDAGNSVNRGRKFGTAELKITEKQATLRVTISLTAAQNGYEYFARWEEDRWAALPAGRKAYKETILKEFRPPKVRLKKNG